MQQNVDLAAFLECTLDRGADRLRVGEIDLIGRASCRERVLDSV